jgi:hypothetical protein
MLLGLFLMLVAIIFIMWIYVWAYLRVVMYYMIWDSQNLLLSEMNYPYVPDILLVAVSDCSLLYGIAAELHGRRGEQLQAAATTTRSVPYSCRADRFASLQSDINWGSIIHHKSRIGRKRE